ncbi:RecQ family ATP-dependent DNA helicase [Bosea sp. RAC05]|uniref:RecQ family ATP-dependent DNA helicase n=1 Tax=Bosea sp. RAC05 TaxID=1842539 RepID=UPI0008584F4A|nr:ATP-dependent DNA helicase RecQ [Bosea sp. RAC05]AOG03469.1 ATP-dependent DNA helicase, RecQ family protein [Bosea sp. RAC05]
MRHSFHGLGLPPVSLRRIGEPIEEVLKRVFGFDHFRGIQREAVEGLVEGRDVLALMTTGGGKSLCYQVPGLVLPGTALIVSPLLALMRDQADALRRKGIRAAALASEDAQGQIERQEVLSALRDGTLDFLYVSPERLSSPSFRSRLSGLCISVIAVDEAHAVCEWGKDFRPAYLELADALGPISAPRIALTATASPDMANEIRSRLLAPDAIEVRTGFDRPNIALNVRRCASPSDELRKLLRNHPVSGSTLVYLPTRQLAEETAQAIGQWGMPAVAYHAGLADTQRSSIQDDFLAGRAPIVCATSAFGMGIDHPDVRRVVHLGLPSSLSAYYQEIGRAGRDGEAAEARLFWTPGDIARRTRLLIGVEPVPRRREVARLESVLGYVETPGCRRSTILRCFGDEHPGDCGNCDLCQHPPARTDGSVILRSVISLAGRLGEDSSVSLLAEGLAGNMTARVRDAGIHRLPEFGAGKAKGLIECKSLIRQGIGLGLLEASEINGVVLPTKRGRAQLRSSDPVLVISTSARGPRQASSGAGSRRDGYWADIIEARLRVSTWLGERPSAILSDAAAIALVEAIDDEKTTRALLRPAPEEFSDLVEEARARHAPMREQPTALALDLF